MSVPADELSIDGVRWWVSPNTDPVLLRPLLERASNISRNSATNEKSGRRKELYRLKSATGAVLVKVNRYDGDVSALRRLRAGKARRELRIATGLRDRGISTPIPLAAGERRSAGLLSACYLLVPAIEGARDLQDLWRSSPLPSARRTWARDLGALARRLHDAGLLQHDFAPNNFLVDVAAYLRDADLHAEDPAPILPIDFERARLRGAPIRGLARGRMLATLDRHLSGASAATRLRVLIAYAQGDSREARRWWKRIRAVAPSIVRQDLAHLRRTATSSSRRFQPITAGTRGEWRGWARRDSSLLPALEWDLGRSKSQQLRRDRSDAISIEGGGALWRWSASGLGARGSRHAWANAQLLWMRGETTPRPVAMLRRGAQTLLWLERMPESHRLSDLSECDAALRAGRTLVERLRSLGRVAPDLQPGGIAAGLRDGHWHAQLLDICAFRPAPLFGFRGENSGSQGSAGRLASGPRGR